MRATAKLLLASALLVASAFGGGLVSPGGGADSFAALGTSTVRGVSKEVWLAIRTDSKPGKGTAEDPFDASSPTGFVTKFNSLPANTRIRLAPSTYHVGGTFNTAQLYLPDGSTVESKGATIIVDNLGATSFSTQFPIIGSLHAGQKGNMVKGITFDCNLQNQSATNAAIGAVYLTGSNCLIEDCEAINWGTKDAGKECFIFQAWTFASSGSADIGNKIVNCRVNTPAPVVHASGTTAISVSGNQGGTTIGDGWLVSPEIKGCVVSNVTTGTASGLPNYFHAYGTTGSVGANIHNNEAYNLIGTAAASDCSAVYTDTYSTLKPIFAHNVFINVNFGFYVRQTSTGHKNQDWSILGNTVILSGVNPEALALAPISGAGAFTNFKVSGNTFLTGTVTSGSSYGVDANFTNGLAVDNNTIDVTGVATRYTTCSGVSEFNNKDTAGNFVGTPTAGRMSSLTLDNSGDLIFNGRGYLDMNGNGQIRLFDASSNLLLFTDSSGDLELQTSNASFLTPSGGEFLVLNRGGFSMSATGQFHFINWAGTDIFHTDSSGDLVLDTAGASLVVPSGGDLLINNRGGFKATADGQLATTNWAGNAVGTLTSAYKSSNGTAGASTTTSGLTFLDGLYTGGTSNAVTAVSVATANGISGSSSGGATPALTLALGAITPTKATISDTGASGHIPLTLSFGGSYPGGNTNRDAIVFKTNDGALGDFSLGFSQNPGIGNLAGTRGDNQLWWGYNNASSPSHVAGDDTFGFNLENSYNASGVRQGEFYFVAQSGDGGLNTRPFGITPHYDDHVVVSNFAVDQLVIGPPSGVDNGVIIYSSKPAGVITESVAFQANTNGKIDFAQYRRGESGITHDFITRGGSDILGLTSGDVGRLFGGYTTTTIGADYAADGLSNIVAYVGDGTNNGLGLRWNHLTALGEFQNTPAGSWFPIVGTTATQTLTGKTMSGASNTFSALPAAGISGVIPIANLATGTPTGSKFVRDDGTLATPSGGATIPSVTNLLKGDGSGGVSDGGIAASNVALLNASQNFTGTNNGFSQATPHGKVDINGSLVVRGNDLSSVGTAITLSHDGTSGLLQSWNSTPLRLQNAGGADIYFDTATHFANSAIIPGVMSTGDPGNGPAATAATSIGTASGVSFIKTWNSSPLAIYTAGAEVMRIATTGGVSVGTTTDPGAGKLSSTNGFVTTAVGGTLAIKSGTNAKAGTFTLSSGTVTVSNTSVTANSVVCCTVKTASGTLGTGSPEIVITASTGFTATGVATDNSTYNFVILEVN